MIFIGLIFIGILVGLLSTIFGVGGGILIIPTLYTFFEFLPPQVVIATSLAIIFFNSARNSYNFTKAGIKPKFSYLAPIAISMLVGVIIGGKLIIVMDAKTIKLIFSILVFCIALKTIFNKKGILADDNWSPVANRKNTLLGILTGLTGGLISGMTGLGGGAILIPLFIIILKIPFKQLSVNCNVCMAVGTFTGMITYLIQPTPTFIFNYRLLEIGQVGYVNFSIVLALFIGATISSKMAIKWTQRVNPKLANRLFSVLLLIISIKMFVSSQFY